MNNILEQRLRDGVLIFDGAMGTELYKRDFFVNTSFDSLNLTAPDVISKIHRSYFEAGADVLTTNTFSANRYSLSKFGLEEKFEEINRAAVDIAKKAGGEDTLIAGSIGPVENHSRMTPNQIVDILSEQVGILEDAGVDFIIFETIPSVHDAKCAFKAANKGGKLPYMISFSIDRSGESQKGEPMKNLINAISGRDRGPSALGLNCCVGPEGILTPLENILSLTHLPIVVQPNAGVPKQVGGRMIYMASPEYLTTYSLRFVNLGASGIGGCCGTGPDHIKVISMSIKKVAVVGKRSLITEVKDETTLQQAVPTGEKSKLGAKIANGEWVVTVEIVPPKGFDLSLTIEKAKQCAEVGIDAINIPDGPRASSRISPLITSLKIEENANIETILHFCCRDRNLIGMQSDLLGCAAAGVRNILFITGDPPKLGHYPDASAVFDADSYRDGKGSGTT